jgi:hypothetical protein
MADEKDEIAAWAVSRWMKVFPHSGTARAVNPALIETIEREPSGMFVFTFASGEAVKGHVSARLLETEGTIFHDLAQEAKNG